MKALVSLVAAALVLAGCEAEQSGAPWPSSFSTEVAEVGDRSGLAGSEDCGPYFVAIPEATVNLKLDIVIFKLKRQMVEGLDTQFMMTVTRDRLVVVIDDTKTAPFVTINPPAPSEIRISKADLDKAPCLKRSGTPGSRI